MRYPMIDTPPENVGALKPIVTAPDCADTDAIVGGLATTASISNDRVTEAAAAYTLLPAWLAVIVQRPMVMVATVRPVNEHTVGVSLVSV
ncbi:MAG: hypothetical protein ACO29A_09660, partial [Ilumatobacteraceae bacterium]